MKQRMHVAAVFAALVIPALIAGCSKNNPVAPAPAGDQQYFQTVVSGNDNQTRDLITSDVEALDESADLYMKGEIFRKQAAAAGTIAPMKFGRRITGVTRSIISPATMFGDTVAIVHTQTVITGEFVIRASTPAGDTTYRKPFTETLHRDLRFERVMTKAEEDDDEEEHDEDEHEGDDNHQGDEDHHGLKFGVPLFQWRLVAASIINGGTTPPGPTIQSIQLISPAETLIVVNPDQYFMATKGPWKHMPKLKNAPVTLRVTLLSASPDTEIVALHHLLSDEGLRKKLFTLVSQTGGGGSFTRVYELNWLARIKGLRKFGHLVVSALTHASVYDDNPQAYASTIWGIPYLPSN